MTTILEDLQLCWYQLKKEGEDSFKILVNDEWLEALVNKGLRKDNTNVYQSGLKSAIECKLLLEPSNTEPLPAGLHKLHIIALSRSGRARYNRVKKKDGLYTDHSLPQFMCLIDYEISKLEKGKVGNEKVPCSIQPSTLSQEVFEDVCDLLTEPDNPASQHLIGSLVSDHYFYFCFNNHPFSLKDVICYTPMLLSGSHRPLFIVYQLLQYLRWLHSHGLTHDNLTTTNLFVDERLLVKVGPPRFGLQPEIKKVKDKKCGDPYPFTGAPDSLLSACGAWIKGYISNLDYLLLLNKFAGRKEGDPNLHPIVPWVMNFSSVYGGWRDLSKSKFRLNKGDQHLDSTYKICGMRVSPPSWLRSRRSFHEEDFELPVTPHHLYDTLSEITYFSYLARIMPVALLCKYVRSKWEPQEYPSSMAHLYSWTPDECIPEFYTDTSIFRSVHEDLPDLAIPPWASNERDFIRKHRDALEGDYVSSRLHCWIDLMFGEKLFGTAAVQNKNVFKELVDNHTSITNKGVRQLFQYAHPRRLCSTPPIPQLPQSVAEIIGGSRAEVCEEPDYGEDETGSAPRRSTFHQATKEAEKRTPIQRNLSVDPSMIKKIINKKVYRSEGTTLDSIQELIFSPVRLTKEEENIAPKIRYLNQFFSSLGGSIWIDKDKLDTERPPSPPPQAISQSALQRRDIQSVGCVMVEMLSSTHVPEYPGMGGARYLQEAGTLWRRNKDDIFLCFNDLIDYLLNSTDIFCTTEHLLHPLSNNIATPPYFKNLYHLICCLEQQETAEENISYCGTYFQNNPKFLSGLGSSGMLLLLGFLKPLFTGPSACKTFIKLFDGIAVHCDNKSLDFLSDCLEQFYRGERRSSERLMLSNVHFVMSVKRHFGLKHFLNKFIGFLIDDIVDTERSTVLQTDTQTYTHQVQASPLAVECYTTLKQILPTLGPILTAQFVTNRLLQVVVGCHVYNETTGSRSGGEDLLTKFLIDVALVYGEAFIDTQYIPMVFHMVKSSMFKVTNKNEGRLLAAVHVVGESIKCLDVPTLHNMLTDLQKFIFEPIMRLLTSSRILFPHSGSGRVVLCESLSQLLVLIVKHIQYSYIQDPQTGKSIVLPLVQQFFQMFDVVSYLYMDEVTLQEEYPEGRRLTSADHVISPSQYSLLYKSQEADYFIHLKEQFPQYPKRYHSNSVSESAISDQQSTKPELGSSPVSGELNLAETLQLETESLVVDSETLVAVEEDGDVIRPQHKDSTEGNIPLPERISLLPGRTTAHSEGRPTSMILTDSTDPDSSSQDKEMGSEADPRGGGLLRPGSSSSSSISSDEGTVPDGVDDVTSTTLLDSRDRVVQDQIEKCLSPEVAQETYVQLCRLIGQETLRRALDNIELIEVLAYMDIPVTSSSELGDVTVTSSSGGGLETRSRYTSESAQSSYTYPSPLLTCRSLDQSDSLRDSWRRVWEGSVTSDNFTFRHVHLQQFIGHADRINALKVTEDECFMLSGSKDKSMILWDLNASNSGLGTKVKKFEEHVRPILGLEYLDYNFAAVSMDNQLTICTDLERQKVTAKFESKNGAVLTRLPRASHRIMQGTSDSTLRTFDTRVRDGVVMEWKVATPLRSVQIIKAIQCDPTGTWVAAGFSSGAIHVLDLRVGILMHSSRPHQQDITKVLCSPNDEVFTSSSDSAASVCHWKRSKTFTEGHPPDYKYQGYRDGVTGMSLIDDELVTFASHRITTISATGNTSTKLRSDHFRGGVSSMTVLPMNKLVVLGSDSGAIRLLA